MTAPTAERTQPRTTGLSAAEGPWARCLGASLSPEHPGYSRTIPVIQVRLSRLGTYVALSLMSLSVALRTAALPTTQGGITMKKTLLLFSVALLALGRYVGTAHPTERTPALLAQTAPDNTGRNVRDRGGLTLTPGDQFESEADRPLTQEIRKAVVADDSLSTLAKNIKIITVDGVVTLRGPVQSLQEKETIETMAQQIAGIDKIDNQLEVKGC
jgi:hyperosmotically inducible protein